MAKCSHCSAPLPKSGIICSYCGSRNNIDLEDVPKFINLRPELERTCPVCHIQMQTINVGKKLPLFIERCESCYGIFFDIDELETMIEKSVKGTLISCGGGFYKVNNLKKLGTVVLLDASFEWIHNRLKTAKNAEAKLAKRPLFSKEKEAKKLYKEREKSYKKLADVVVDVEKLTLDEQLEFIAKKCKV